MKKNLIYGFAMAILGGLTSLGIYKTFEPKIAIKTQSEETDNTKLVSLISPEPSTKADYVTAAEASIDGVVHVKTVGTVEYHQRTYDPFRELLYGNGSYHQKYIQPIKGAGSGVIISEEGYIVTNNHVIENADEIEVTLNNKKTYTAELIGRDPTTDIAVLKINAGNLHPLEYGNSDNLRIGEWVLAVGNPFNLTSTVTAGIVSAKSRDINILGSDPMSNMSSIESFIQTDAAVNPGNSGGALVNTKGELVGINTAIKSNTGSYAGYSFAVPANIVKKVVNDLVEFGTIQRAYIGVSIQNIDQELAKENKIEDLNGVYVNGLSENGSAKAAGIKEGDIVKAINRIPVKNVNELQAKVGEYRPGDEIEVTLLRGEQTITKSIVLKNMEGNTKVISNEKLDVLKTLGAQLDLPSKEEMEQLKIKGGAKVSSLFSGAFQKSGIREGYIITKVDNSSISSPDELIGLLKDKKGGVLIQGIYPNGREAYYGFGL
jgi:Do/DeqQ family serine protease